MVQPSSGTAIPRGDLAVAVEEYREDSKNMGFIGEELMPTVMVGEQSAKYPVIPKEVMLQEQDTKRAMGGYYNRSGWDYEEGFYMTSENGHEEPIDKRQEKIYSDKLDVDLIATKRATKIVLRSQERRIATRCNTAANFHQTAVAKGWKDYDNATPVDDVNAAVQTIRKRCGMLPNLLQLPWDAFVDLKRCAQVIELLRYTFPGEKINSMSAEMLAQILNVPKIAVAGAMTAGSEKKKDTTLSEMWDPDLALLTIVSTDSDIAEPCLGRTFRWDEENGGGEAGTIVEEYEENANRSRIIRVRHDSDERLIKSYDESGNVLSDISKAVSQMFTGISAAAAG